jgi:hypothetical protein
MFAMHSSERGSAHACRLLAAVIAAVGLSACANTQPAVRTAGAAAPTADLYEVGPVRVLLRPQPEVEFMCRLHTQQQATPGGRILGCYVPGQRAIISVPDAHVLLHEFKHYFEGPFHD